jgi:hypothetical protein
LERAIELKPNILKSDTHYVAKKILIHDSVFLEKIVTVFQFGKKDTSADLPAQVHGGKKGKVTIRNRKDGVDVIVDRPADTVFLHDTIVIKVPVITNKYILPPPTNYKSYFTVSFISFIFGLLSGVFLTYKFYNSKLSKK